MTDFTAQFMTRFNNPETTSFETENRKLAYNNEFREKLRENPGIMKAAIDLVGQAETDYQPENLTVGKYECSWNSEGFWEIVKVDGQAIEQRIPLNKELHWTRGVFFKPDRPYIDETTGLQVSVLGKSDREWERAGNVVRIEKSAYAKLSLGDTSYFVKKSTATNNPAYSEFTNAMRAKEALAQLPFVHVVDAKLGFQDKKQSWFVSKWEELENQGFGATLWFQGSGFNDYGQPIDTAVGRLSAADHPTEHLLAESEREEQEVVTNMQLIERTLHEAGIPIHDIADNLFFNPQTKTYILLDITTAGTEGLNQTKNPS